MRDAGSAWVTALLGAVCVVATVLAYIGPLAGSLGDVAPDPTVRLASAPFVHGFSLGSAIPHLVGNLLLLAYAGPVLERALGAGRLAALTAAALVAYAVIQAIWNLEVNGASVFVWAFAPPLAVLHSRRRSRRATMPGPTVVVLLVMWVIVPVAMTAVPYGFGWSGSPVTAFLVANTFHLSATVVGMGAAWAWRAPIEAAWTRAPRS